MKLLKVASLSMLFLSAVAHEALAGGIVPHRAIYDIKFNDSTSQTKINGGAGKWVMELTGSACTGYNISYRFVTQLVYEEGGEILIDTRGKNFESGEGNAYDFSNSTYQNNELTEDVKGLAARRKEGNITVQLTRPETAELSLPDGVLFPVQHFVKLIEQAKSGDTVVTSSVYEGVEGGKEALDVTAVIGKEQAAEAPADQSYRLLEEQNMRRWPVSLSYYKKGATNDATPEWQNSFILYENGVSRDFIFDYGDFSLTGILTKLEFLPLEDCS